MPRLYEMRRDAANVCGVMARLVLSTFAIIGVAACHDFVSPAPPGAGQPVPDAYDSPAGAVQQVIGVRSLFARAAAASVITGMTDELVGMIRDYQNFVVIDRRDNIAASALSGLGDPYGQLQVARVNANLAQGALGKYANDTPASLRAEMLAAQGYTELFLADLYCSGIPLSTIDFEGNFTFQSGSSTAEVDRHAATLFAEAAPLATTSDSIIALARVGWGRALLAQGLYDSAAHVVADVPTAALYVVRRYSFVNQNLGISLGDREGQNGLPYRSTFDPRIVWRATTVFSPVVHTELLLESEFGADSVVVPIASGIEARLIEAEAQLQHVLSTHATGDVAAWLQTLNTLRTTGDWNGTDSLFQVDSVGFDFGSSMTIYDSTLIRIDTVWHPGTGGIARLGPLDDPGIGLSGTAADSARVDLMFHERAFWLFLRGQRQGDMRRLIRQYHRTQAQVYPTGIYPLGGAYGSAVNLPVQDKGNPRFHGCINRGA